MGNRKMQSCFLVYKCLIGIKNFLKEEKINKTYHKIILFNKIKQLVVNLHVFLTPVLKATDTPANNSDSEKGWETEVVTPTLNAF